MKSIVSRFQNSNLIIQALISILTFILYGYTSTILDASYQASRFPVSYFIGQTSFDGDKIKGWYQYMINASTFDIYLRTQFIDFLFITSVVLGGFFIWTLVANLHSQDSFFRKWGYVFAFALPLAGLFDIFENLVSFFMIANPLNFSDVLAFVYSTLAAIKFGFWVIAICWLFLSLVTWAMFGFRKIMKRIG